MIYNYNIECWNLILKLILRWKNRFWTYSISFWFYIQHLSWSRNHPTWHDYLHWLWFISHITRTLGIRKLYQRLYRSVLSNSSGPSFLSSSSIYVYVLMYVLYHPMYNLGVNVRQNYKPIIENVWGPLNIGSKAYWFRLCLVACFIGKWGQWPD